MATRLKIAPAGDAWPDPALLEGQVTAWETSLGAPLPPGYRRILTEFGGGRVWPNVFQVDMPGDGDSERLLDLIYAPKPPVPSRREICSGPRRHGASRWWPRTPAG